MNTYWISLDFCLVWVKYIFFQTICDSSGSAVTMFFNMQDETKPNRTTNRLSIVWKRTCSIFLPIQFHFSIFFVTQNDCVYVYIVYIIVAGMLRYSSVLRIIFASATFQLQPYRKYVFYMINTILLLTALCPLKKHKTYKYRSYKCSPLAIQSNITWYFKQFHFQTDFFMSWN